MISKWAFPRKSCLKVDIDVAIDASRSCSGLGMVVRDHCGTILALAVWRLEGYFDPEVAEALALRQAMVQCHLFGYDHIIFELDCLSIVQKLHNKLLLNSSLGLVLSTLVILIIA
uniref:RNase H type-1 domain-containing protein n=1 Tax=Cannabis sativa TaxID=3483 RepID=A0A803Q9R9_CANSA